MRIAFRQRRAACRLLALVLAVPRLAAAARPPHHACGRRCHDGA